MHHQVPVFVVLPGKESKTRRSLKLGWVFDFDDENRQFLVLFADEPPKYDPAKAPDEPFQLMSQPKKKGRNRNGEKGATAVSISGNGAIRLEMCGLRYSVSGPTEGCTHMRRSTARK
jgi:hypothetical protein